MNDLTLYIDRTIKPALRGGLGVIMPNFESLFKLKGDKWVYTGKQPYTFGEVTFKQEDYIWCNSLIPYSHSANLPLASGNGRQGKDIISLYQELHHIESTIEVCKILARLYNREEPPKSKFDTQTTRKREEQKDKIKQANEYFVNALWNTPRGKLVLSYLMSRGYSDEVIRKMGVGCITEEIINSKEFPKFEITSDGINIDWLNNNSNLYNGIGRDYILTIPIFKEGKIIDYKFRTLNPNEKIKYKFRKGAVKSEYLLDPNKGKSEICILVEGELDTLHAFARGVVGVCGSMGNYPSLSSLENAIKRGYKKFILFFDNDVRKEGKKAGANFTEITIDNLEKLQVKYYDIEIYCVSYNYYFSDESEKVKDPDEILTKYGIELFTQMINNAVMPWNFLADKYIDDFTFSNGENNITTIKFEQIKKDLISLIFRYPQHENAIRNYIYTRLENDYIPKEDIKKQIDIAISQFKQAQEEKEKEIKESEKKQRESKYINDLKSLLENGGDIESVKNLYKEFEVTEAKESNDYSEVFEDLTFEQWKSLLAEIPEGIPTGLVFETQNGVYENKANGVAVPFYLETGITFVCAETGHGKTSFLNMLALNETYRNIQSQTGKQVLYFSYEVSKQMMVIDLLNCFVNDCLISGDYNLNPKKAIQAYFRGNSNAISKDWLDKEITHLSNFEEKCRIFLTTYLKTLKIIYEDFEVTELVNLIRNRYNATNGKVSAIFIDYAQLLRKNGFESKLRTEEIKSFVKDLKNLSIEIGVPIICATQFNQNDDSPLSFSVKNIGEGGDFSRVATNIIALYNLEKIPPTISPKQLDILRNILDNHLISDYEQIDGKIQPKPIKGKFLVKLIKSRDNECNISTILKWCGATKHLSVNYPNLLEPVPSSLFDNMT